MDTFPHIMAKRDDLFLFCWDLPVSKSCSPSFLWCFSWFISSPWLGTFGMILLIRFTPSCTPRYFFLTHLASCRHFLLYKMSLPRCLTSYQRKKTISTWGALSTMFCFCDSASYWVLHAWCYGLWQVHGNLQPLHYKRRMSRSQHLPGHFPYLWGLWWAQCR